jgi:serine/threonine protein kinase
VIMEQLVGKTLGQYQIISELGRGGMAVVYKTYQPALQRFVAIKTLIHRPMP